MNNFKILKPNNVSWEDYRDLRLEALTKEPQAFLSSYEKEKNTPNKEWQQRLKNYQEGKGNWMVFASNGNKLVGMLGAFQAEEDIENSTANIIAVYVKREFRGRGISKKLMSNLLDELRNHSIKKVKLSVNVNQTAAVRLYESFGFKTIAKENKILGDNQHHDEYAMEKALE